MFSAGRYRDRFFRHAWILAALAVGAGAILYRALRLLPDVAGLPAVPAPAAVEWAKSVAPTAYEWSVFEDMSGPAAPADGTLARRFRLAGTFFTFGDGLDARKAILDIVGKDTQSIVGENERVEDVDVVRILRDSVILRGDAGEEQLWLSSGGSPRAASTGGADGSAGVGADDGAGSEPDRFGGRQIGEHRWVFSRDALMDYYQELRDEPERLVAVFDSLSPMYSDDGAITGYQLGVEGEADFFGSVGLKAGDVVRKVNSMPMTSRRRAEYFIGEFVENRGSAFVLDVERDGTPQKLIYEIR